METEIDLLRRIEGLKLEVLEASCCGLAGAFGYDKAALRHLARAGRTRAAAGHSQQRGQPETLVVADGYLLPLANPPLLPRNPRPPSGANAERRVEVQSPTGIDRQI